MNSPTPKQIKSLRLKYGFTQTESADLIHCKRVTWQNWESNNRTMHPAFWELFKIKLKRL